MEESPDGKYRPRREETENGLAHEEESARRPRPSGLELIGDKTLDISEVGGLQLIPLTDQLMPEGVADLDTAAAEADFGIASLLAEQRSERVAHLIARVQTLIADRQWRPALGVIQEARTADPKSAHAMVLQAQCLMELGHYEPALRVLSHARDQATDPEIRSLLLRREAACVRATTKALEARLVELVGAGKLDAASKLVQEGLARQPSNIVFLYHLASLQCRGSDVGAARRTLEEARRHMGRESMDLIAELERTIELGQHAAAVEAARQALRRGDAGTALTQLESYADVLGGNEHYDGLRDYARELRPGALGLLRASRSTPPAAAARQQTLRWLLAEEIRQGDDALRADRFARAQEAFENAERIDARCGAVCYKHAQALYRKHDQSRAKKQAMTPEAQQDLARAEDLAARASIDAGYEEAAEALVTRIKALRQQR